MWMNAIQLLRIKMYVKNNLLSDETLIYWSRPHWIIFSTPVIIFLISILVLMYGSRIFAFDLEVHSLQIHEIVSLVILLIAMIAGIVAYIRFLTTEYAITNKRILMKSGWISRNVLELFLPKIEAIHIGQSIPGRVFNFGTLVIIGTGGTRDPFDLVPDPLNFRRLAQIEINKTDQGRFVDNQR